MINHKPFALKCKYGHAFSVETGEETSLAYEVMLPESADLNIRVAKRKYVTCPFCNEQVYAIPSTQEKGVQYFSNLSEANIFVKDMNKPKDDF